MEFTSLQDLAQLLYQKGMRHFVLSPGSRSAPLTLALVRQPGLSCYTVTDERSAAYLAMGLAQGHRQITGMVCTSGTAALNYGPAIAEAFFQQVPLLVITADRPSEWIDQADGQTIFQQNLYGAHVKGSFQLAADFHTHPDSRWEANRVINEAVNLATAPPYGPVHVNIPLREPLYPAPGHTYTAPPQRTINEYQLTQVPDRYVMHDWVNTWQATERRLIVVGQTEHNPDLFNAIYALSHYSQVSVLADITSQQHRIKDSLPYGDLFLGAVTQEQLEALRPDLLITVGKSLISKNLKLFLRNHKATQHWHLQPHGKAADTFQSLTHLLRFDPTHFLTKLGENSYFTPPGEGAITYGKSWSDLSQRAYHYTQSALAQPGHAELQLMGDLLQLLPDPCDVHLGNSMPVRYANLVGLRRGHDAEVFCNRGTSGIDGCISTAVGVALARPNRQQLVLVGDATFLYDRNGLWHNYLPPNLHIVVFNNGGGNIFRLLPGPAAQPELKEYFETRQMQTAQATAQMHGLRYFSLPVGARPSLATFKEFYEGGASLWEVFTDGEHNAAYFQQFKAGFRQSLGQ